MSQRHLCKSHQKGTLLITGRLHQVRFMCQILFQVSSFTYSN